ncbi:MAG: Dabb family protein [Armatimonadetes bacterium]|nr:MAG: Dabb family protein [Armatimonadota bacterium]
MIRHCAFFRFQPDITEEQIDQLLGGFVALQDQIGGILDITVGRNVSPGGLGRGFDHGIVMDLVNAAAVEAYLEHPLHLAHAETVVSKLEGGLAGALVFDFERTQVDRHD